MGKRWAICECFLYFFSVAAKREGEPSAAEISGSNISPLDRGSVWLGWAQGLCWFIVAAVTRSALHTDQGTRDRGLHLEGSWGAAGDLRLQNMISSQRRWCGPGVLPLPSCSHLETVSRKGRPNTGPATVGGCSEGLLEGTPAAPHWPHHPVLTAQRQQS